MAQENILFPNNPPQEGDQFTVGNTTYAWDPTPGIWRAFTTATSSGGGGGLVLGEFFSQTVTASTTSLTLDHTGPAWVFLTAGSGSGAVRVNTSPDPGDTGRGGNGGSGGFFLQDVSVLEGANVVIGTGGAGRSITRQPNQEQAGRSGTGSSITWSGITLTCTAGAGAGIVTNGADGMSTITGTDAPTLLTNAEVTTEAEAYWHDFVVTSTGGNLQLGSSSVSVPVATGSAGRYTQANAGTTGTATSAAGSAGQLYIVYQNQASGGSSGGGGTTINIGGAGGGGSPVIISFGRSGTFTNTTITTDLGPDDVTPGDSAMYQGQQVWDTNVQSAENWLSWNATIPTTPGNSRDQELFLNGILISTITIDDTRTGGGETAMSGADAVLIPQAAIDARSGGQDTWRVIMRGVQGNSGGTTRNWNFSVAIYTH